MSILLPGLDSPLRYPETYGGETHRRLSWSSGSRIVVHAFWRANDAGRFRLRDINRADSLNVSIIAAWSVFFPILNFRGWAYHAECYLVIDVLKRLRFTSISPSLTSPALGFGSNPAEQTESVCLSSLLFARRGMVPAPYGLWGEGFSCCKPSAARERVASDHCVAEDSPLKSCSASLTQRSIILFPIPNATRMEATAMRIFSPNQNPPGG